MAAPGTETLAFTDIAGWEAWLAANHGRHAEVWLEIAKKGSTRTSVSITEALDVALCFGWIDGQRRAGDQDHFLQRYSPRRPKSSWSQVNVAKVEALIAAGRMREPGFAAIAAAKADGRWDAAYESQRNATTPPDLAAALAEDQRAQAHFDQLGRSERYDLYLRLMKATTPSRRAIELRRIVELRPWSRAQTPRVRSVDAGH